MILLKYVYIDEGALTLLIAAFLLMVLGGAWVIVSALLEHLGWLKS